MVKGIDKPGLRFAWVVLIGIYAGAIYGVIALAIQAATGQWFTPVSAGLIPAAAIDLVFRIADMNDENDQVEWVAIQIAELAVRYSVAMLVAPVTVLAAWQLGFSL